MDYSNTSYEGLIEICKQTNLEGYSGKGKEEIIALLTERQQQDTGKFRTNLKDQFYTQESVAAACIQHILKALPAAATYLWVEPSAGSGSFLRKIPPPIKKLGLDIDPKGDNIQQQDYLTWIPPRRKKILVVGNPPFGRQSCLAKSFIAKSCEFAEAIAFILPKSFTKPSMSRVFDLKFHPILCVELEKHSFMLNGVPYDVPCVFQIWEKRAEDRHVEPKVASVGFEYTKGTDAYTLAVRRVGGLAGKCFPRDGTAYSLQSHYFLTIDARYLPHVGKILEKMNHHTFPSNTVGPRSLSKTEINTVLNTILLTLTEDAP